MCTLDTERPEGGWWSAARFLDAAKSVHGSKFSYPDIVEGAPIKSYSSVNAVCKLCGYVTDVSVDSHIKYGVGCASCDDRMVWTSRTFHKNARHLLGWEYERYDYYVAPDMIEHGIRSHLHVRCKTCKRRWFPTIESHILKKEGCPFVKVHPAHKTAK